MKVHFSPDMNHLAGICTARNAQPNATRALMAIVAGQTYSGLLKVVARFKKCRLSKFAQFPLIQECLPAPIYADQNTLICQLLRAVPPSVNNCVNLLFISAFNLCVHASCGNIPGSPHQQNRRFDPPLSGKWCRIPPGSWSTYPRSFHELSQRWSLAGGSGAWNKDNKGRLKDIWRNQAFWYHFNCLLTLVFNPPHLCGYTSTIHQ